MRGADVLHRGPCRHRSGTKTVSVLVKRSVPHPRYVKRVTTSKKFLCHDEAEEYQEGDYVLISPIGKKLSKRKSWEVTKMLKESPLRAEAAAAAAAAALADSE